jgi:hypothetical protein
LEIFESLTRKKLFDLNLDPETLCELIYIAFELGFANFYVELRKYSFDKYENIENLIRSTSLLENNPFLEYKLKYYAEDEYLKMITMDRKIELLKETKKFKVIVIYNNLLRFIVRFWIKKFFIDQYFTAKYIAIKLKYPQIIYEPVTMYQEGEEFKIVNYDLTPKFPDQTKTILNLSDEIITDILLYLKLEEIPNYEYFVMGFRSSHPRLWKVVSLFMKEHML